MEGMQSKANEHNEVFGAKSRMVIRVYIPEPGEKNSINMLQPQVSRRRSCCWKVKRKIKLSHCDIQQAFVQVFLEEVDIKGPPVCGDFTGRLARPSKPFHGIKKALHEIHELTYKLVYCGFELCLTDTCMFGDVGPREERSQDDCPLSCM